MSKIWDLGGRTKRKKKDMRCNTILKLFDRNYDTNLTCINTDRIINAYTLKTMINFKSKSYFGIKIYVEF